MSRKPKIKEKIVCFCYNVSEATVIEAIQNGCKSLMDIRRETYASTGCAGCSEEVKKLIRKHASDDSGAGGEAEGSKVSNG